MSTDLKMTVDNAIQYIERNAVDCVAEIRRNAENFKEQLKTQSRIFDYPMSYEKADGAVLVDFSTPIPISNVNIGVSGGYGQGSCSIMNPLPKGKYRVLVLFQKMEE